VPTSSRTSVAVLAAVALLVLSKAASSRDTAAAYFLVAAPSITDGSFRETVVLIVQQTPTVTRGLIINRPLDTSLARLSPGDGAFDHAGQSVYFGGPVALPHLSFVFRSKKRREGSLHVMDDVYLGESASLLKDLLRHERAADSVRVYAGHAGWGPGQLQDEIERGSWFILPATAAYVFHGKPASIWSELVKTASLRRVRAPVLSFAALR